MVVKSAIGIVHQLLPRTPRFVQRIPHDFYTCRQRSTARGNRYVLGIETSCDDTGVAIVDENGQILGESLHSQIRTHVERGGIVPPVARDLHKDNIDRVVGEAMAQARLDFSSLDAVAVSVEPGLVSCLRVGLNKAISLCKSWNVPLIPIHHMKAHALTIRLSEKVNFPFLVLLTSGGHCLLTVATNPDEFILLGSCLDDAPGECFDKTARRLRLKLLPGFDSISGGQAIEKLAVNGDYRTHAIYNIMTQRPDCNFSFAGMKNHFNRVIKSEEERQNCSDDGVLSNVADICASLQYSVARHLCRRLQRAFAFCDMRELLPQEGRILVLSGGVGSNQFVRKALRNVCQQYGCELLCPPPRLCTDNGVMIAWNGMEKLLIKSGLTYDYDSLDVRGRSPLGPNLSDEIQKTHIVKLQKIKIL